MTIQNSLRITELRDEASAWFTDEANKFNAITRGPDLQWHSKTDGTFEVHTTKALTPGRMISCQDYLHHSDAVEQSFWFCPEVSEFTTRLYEAGEVYLQSSAKICRDTTYNDGPMDRSAVFLRRWVNMSMLIISSGRETYLVKVPDEHLREFIRISIHQEDNVTYLSHLRNNV